MLTCKPKIAMFLLPLTIFRWRSGLKVQFSSHLCWFSIKPSQESGLFLGVDIMSRPGLALILPYWIWIQVAKENQPLGKLGSFHSS